MKKHYDKLKNDDKQKLINEYLEVEKLDKKVLNNLKKSKLKPKTKTKQKTKPKQKTFDEIIIECFKNKTIPKNTPPIFKKKIKEIIKNYNEGIEYVKSDLRGFATIYYKRNTKAYSSKIFSRNTF